MIEKKRILSHGWAIICLSLLLTVIIWITTLLDYTFIYKDPFLFCSKLLALVGTVGMCWTFIFSTRLGILETMFAGLDKLYHAHRIMGIFSFSLIFFHPIFQILRFIPDWKYGVAFFLHQPGAIILGIMGYLLFILLIALTLWIKIPYHIWKRTHELFILVLLLALFHTIWIDKQVHDSLLLTLWMYSFFTCALISYIYIRILYIHVGPRYQYQIASILKKGTIWEILVSPKDSKMKYQPAQFIYVAFNNPRIDHEIHPFSVSSSPDEELIRVSIKNLGDFTSKLDALQVGDPVKIWGPYGRFYEKYLFQYKKDAVFIAGGIGITPFLSLLRYEINHPQPRKTFVFYCVNHANDAPYHEEISYLSKQSEQISYFPIYKDIQGFLSIKNIEESIGQSVDAMNFFLCGPYPMMQALSKQLSTRGVNNSQIVYEDFNLLD